VDVDAEHRPLVSPAQLLRARPPFELPARDTRGCAVIPNPKTFLRAGFFSRRNRPRHRAFSPRLHFEEKMMGRGILLWLLGVPIPVIILLWLFFGR
jgi:hypothetical protein